MKIISQIILSSFVLLIIGCSKPAPTETKAEQAAQYQARKETKSIQNADKIGYDGTAIQKKLDKALNQNDQRATELNQQIESQTGEQPKPED